LIIRGNRRDASPIVIGPSGELSRPTRVPFTQNEQEKINEGWIQKLIEDNPDILPVSEIEPAFSPLVTVGCEVSTESGPMDLLLLSPQGYLTIVETKLWRNPEARREVVGQIIDYAKEVSQWSFEDLENKVRDYNMNRYKRNDGIIASLRKSEKIDETAEADITDTLTRNLRNGRFLLLVVGDGIRESVEEMADYLQQTPQLHFTLALVELQIYKIDDGEKSSHLVIPQVVARTREITRAVVRVEGTAIESVKVEVATEITPPGKSGERTTITEDDFYIVLSKRVNPENVDCAHKIIEDSQGLGCIIDWKQGSFVIKIPDPAGSGQKLTLLVVRKDGLIYQGWLEDQLPSMSLPKEIAGDYYRESSQLFGRNLSESSYQGVYLKDLRQHYGEFMNVLQKAINRIKEAAKKE